MKITIPQLLKMKRNGEKITMITAYDYPTAILVDQAGIDAVLIGDSVGMVMLGYSSTLPVTMRDMLH
ncbi:MAG: 3-methyl-2-oxobutanoate hydroxymethyltransferase, partial [Candidatus Methanomethylicia archaeon]